MIYSYINIKDIIKPKYKIILDKELLESIQENGLMNPIEVRELDDNKFEILDGYQRYLAYKKLRKIRIPAVIIIMTNEEYQSYLLLKSINRFKASKEFGKFLIRIMKLNNLTIKELSQKIGRSESTIRRWIKLAKKENK